MTDLTERLAAKLETWMAGDSEVYLDDYGENTLNAKDVAHHAPTILPLLLSEPELVASLSDEVRLSVLTPRERVAIRLGLMAMNEVEGKALTPEGKDG